MGIDVCTYRSRVGLFASCRSAGVLLMPFITDFTQVIKMIGAVTFIRVLLVMAGVEPNPGPGNHSFVFRYQYLLIEVGTEVMQKLFDDVIGTDFGTFLVANVAAANKLQWLIGSGKITKAQQNYLPPIDTNPLTSNFDISLLCCLLRNVCGLRCFNDAVWTNPAPADHSLEADVTRLRECRNHVSHMPTVHISDTDLAVKWTELTEILKRLNSFHSNGVTDFTSKIYQAEHMDVDHKQKERYDTLVEQWKEMERLYDLGIGELMKKFEEFEQGLNNLQQDVLEIKQDAQKDREKIEQFRKEQEQLRQELGDAHHDPILDNEKDLKNRLMKMYQEDCCSLPVLPLCEDDEEEVDLLSIYQPPSLFHVPYHRTEGKEEQYPIFSYQEIFSKGDQCFSNVFITGDAGVGKSSFCKCMALLWYKSQCNENVDDEVTQKNIEFMGKFDFTFFVSLRDTDRSDVITMIIEQVYTKTERDCKKNKLCKLVENTLKEQVCLVILDGLDEWTPETSCKNLPDKITADKCSFLITCRPYKIETVRVLRKDLDRQVQMRGLCRKSTKRYVEEIVARCNKANGENKNPNDFDREVKECGLHNQLSIPIIGSHLVAIWFDCKLTDMSRALIYSNILEMLFERAENRCRKSPKKKSIQLPSVPLCCVQLPDSLADLVYFKTHFALLGKICFLSFRSLFKLGGKCASILVFTKKQLMSEPYFFSDEEMDFLCKIGILSRNKVIGRFGKQEQKLSFLHKSYLEYFAALFVSSFDSSNAFDTVVKEWTTINDIVQFQIFFIFLTGFSCEKVKFLFEDIYLRISDDLTCCRINAIFHYNYLGRCADTEQITSLQSMVVNCFKQVSRSSNPNFSLKLEDFISDSKYDIPVFGGLYGDDESYTVSSLKQLVLLNRTCIYNLISVQGKYLVEFDQIKNLQSLHVGGDLLSEGYVYDVKFTECMLQNRSTLHTVCIEGPLTLTLELPVRSLQHLTSLSLDHVKMQHSNFHNVVKFLSDNVLIENIKLLYADCDDHPRNRYSDCTLNLYLPHNTKLTSLSLYNVNILCHNVNNSSLKTITLHPLSERSVSCYIDVFNCIKDSHLEHLYIAGGYMLDDNTIKTLICTVKTLPYIKLLTLFYMKLPDDVLLQLHPDVTQVKIELCVTMSRQCFHCFIESLVNNKSVIKVELFGCKITSVDGETHSVLSEEESWEELLKESVDYMSEYLTSIPTVNITCNNNTGLCFETTGCQ